MITSQIQSKDNTEFISEEEKILKTKNILNELGSMENEHHMNKLNLFVVIFILIICLIILAFTSETTQNTIRNLIAII